MPDRFLHAITLVLLSGWSVGAAEPTAQQLAFFEKEVRPLLIDQCQKCHGAKKQQGGLRVDSRAALLKGGDDGPAIVPGQPDKGTLLAAVKHVGETKMPPKGKLTDAQVAALSRWIAEGAAWTKEEVVTKPGASAEKHWAFQPIRRVEVPSVRDAGWARTAVDRFVRARLEGQGLQPVGPTDRRTLIRRVTFDLTGLPPTPEEIRAFLADQSPNAYEKLVDRLLASPAYGERWGRHWLDVARYADTAGDGADYPVREAGRYRNWVIRAFNADQPYDQFVREQIAGDVLARSGPPELYADRVTATGFLAIGKRYGYNPSPDFQHEDFADAIDSVGRSLLGLSLGCARCHDHKFDPVSMADYYGLYGIFKSSEWSFPGGEEHKKPARLVPLIPPEEAARLDREKANELARIDGEIARLKAERDTVEGKTFAGGVDLGFEGQAIGKPPAGVWLAMGPNRVVAEAQSPYPHIYPPGTRGVRMGTGARNEGIRYVFPNGLRASPGKQMHFTIDFRTVAATAGATQPPGAYRLYIGRGVIESLAVEVSVTAKEVAIRNGAKWEVVRAVEPGTWYTMQLSIDPAKKTYSGVVGKPGDLTTFKDKGVGSKWDGIINTFICDAIGHVDGPAPTRDLDNIGLQEAVFAAPGSPAVAPRAKPADLKERLAKLDAALTARTSERQQVMARTSYELAYGVSEGKPVNARIQKRGEPDKLGAEVPRAFLAILGGDKVDAKAPGSGRLELATWITRASNPLTARVFVNRVWQWHFGRGLVPTASDFGTRGESPSHPELLDYLASRFIESGWSVKELHRLILHSQVYQLSSEDQTAALKVDPENRWLWRYSRRPLDAESIRDAMLAISGQLDRSMPTQHPFPPMEKWGFTIHNPFHAVYDSNHRSTYLMIQRNRRHPFLALFDAADPNLSVAERLPTTTPTQALYLMNAPFVHQQSEALARRLLALQFDDGARVRVAFELAQGREPAEVEVSDGLAFLASYREKLAALGRSTEQQQQMAWAALGRVLMTSNAFLYVD